MKVPLPSNIFLTGPSGNRFGAGSGEAETVALRSPGQGDVVVYRDEISLNGEFFQRKPGVRAMQTGVSPEFRRSRAARCWPLGAKYDAADDDVDDGNRRRKAVEEEEESEE
ncbi:ABC transporter [Anopheles sinensis]|uniref:ABC transporter n=1 Tax=Anopheles sinensis TaxID=74873 RepID=A0A084WPP7_ANOSI|nr:ABC transporter [Anopheles sinensis]